MEALTAAQILDLADAGRDADPVERGLLLLHLTGPLPAGVNPADLPVGQRDRRLIALRVTTLGAVARGRTWCPACGAHLQARVHLPSVLAAPAETPGPYSVVVDGRMVVFRLPTSDDLRIARSAAACGDGTGARHALLTACVRSVDGRPDVELPPGLAREVVAAMAATDALVDVTIRLTCAECGADWPEIFDIVTFFWAEIEARAVRLAADVHDLATAYGWSEPEILTLGPRRRERYLEQVRA
jgi:hypothetical protein